MRNPLNQLKSALESADGSASKRPNSAEPQRADARRSESNGHSGPANSPSSPWNHGTSPAQADLMEASATTATLPAVGGPKDPYAQQDTPTAVRPAGSAAQASSSPVAASGHSAPRSAVDQYAALQAGAPMVAAGAASAASASGVAGRGATAPPPFPAGSPPRVRPAKAIRSPKTASRTPRRAKLQLRHLNVWSVLRFSCVLAIALFFVWLIMVGVLYGVLDVTHVFDKVNDTVRQINGSGNTKNVVTPKIVFGGAFVIGLVNIVLFIALSTIGSIVYNLCADLVGGIEVTFAEHE